MNTVDGKKIFIQVHKRMLRQFLLDMDNCCFKIEFNENPDFQDYYTVNIFLMKVLTDD